VGDRFFWGGGYTTLSTEEGLNRRTDPDCGVLAHR